MTPLEIVRVILDVVSSVLLPVLLYKMANQDRDRTSRFKHLDDCIDDTKTKVIELSNKIASQNVTRADLERTIMQIRAEINMERLERERSSQGLHDRIMRLEDLKLGAFRHGTHSSES